MANLTFFCCPADLGDEAVSSLDYKHQKTLTIRKANSYDESNQLL